MSYCKPMTDAATSPAIGTRATVIAAPGYPTEVVVEVAAVKGRTITASHLTSEGVATEDFTLRRNGKYARKGGGQWEDYLRIADES